jgi:hypothetical protein
MLWTLMFCGVALSCDFYIGCYKQVVALMYSKETGYVHRNSCEGRDLTLDHLLTNIKEILLLQNLYCNNSLCI